MCCVAARRVDLALQALLHMEQDARVRFDPVVFNYMLHPSEVMQNESGTPHALSASALTKGFLQQRRVLQARQDEEEAAGAAAGATRRGAGVGTLAAGVHAMCVFFSITRQVVQQWETIRLAVTMMMQQKQQNQEKKQQQQNTTTMISTRTINMIRSVFENKESAVGH